VRRPRGCVLALVLLAATACGPQNQEPAGPGATGAGDSLFTGLGNGGYDVQHYGLTLDYQPDGGRLNAKADITARATQALSSFNLDLDGLTVRSATVNGKPAGVRREGTELTLTPHDGLRSGRDFTTEIVYDGKPKQITDPDESTEGWLRTDDGAAALGEPTGAMAWFPGNDHPSDKASFDFTVTVPKGLTAVANGQLTAHQGNTFTWHSPEPMATYLASVVIGKFDVKQFRADGRPVYIATDPDEAGEDARDLTKLVPEVIRWGSRLFGPYPFSSAGAIVDHLPDLGYSLETQTKPFFEAAPSEKLVVHEMSHQWFGDSVTPSSWKDMWLNEGFAVYSEWIWEEDHGEETVQENFHNSFTDTEGDTWAFPPTDPPADEISGDPVYIRGAMVLHKVREAVGNKTFFEILKAWTSKYRYGNVDTQKFIDLCESMSGKDLGGVFNTWLFQKKKPAAEDLP